MSSQQSMSKPAIDIGQHSEAGPKQANEDSFGVMLPEPPLCETKGLAMAIADGMSSCDNPKEASETAVKSFLEDYYATHESWSVETSVGRVLTSVNRWLYSQSQSAAAGKGMVTTFTGAVLKAGVLHVFHIGDSRLSLLRGGELRPLTRAHRVRIGEKHDYLSRALGIDVMARVDHREVPVEAGDILVFTTDGVHDFIKDGLIAELIHQHTDDLNAAARAICAAALKAGADDNVTCQLVRIVNPGEPDEKAWLKRLAALPFPPPLQPGQVMDGLRIIRELHASSRSQVYLAEDTETGRKVVVKTPSPNYEDDAAYIEHFMREEWIGRLIDSPHVAKIVQRQTPRKFLYFCMEHVAGQTLRQWMDDRPRPDLAQVRDIAEQIAQGLRAFHRREIIHQDLKPDNIRLDADGTVKIIDFGSAHVASLEELKLPVGERGPRGTAGYTAPELLEGARPHKKQDIFSLGVIIYEMLTGQLPYGKAAESARQWQRLDYVPARKHRHDVPVWLDRALEKAVAKNPARRYDTMSAMLLDIKRPNPAFAEDAGAPLLERDPERFWKGLALLSLLLNAILLGLWLSS